jgi:hypothetical protein
MLFAAVEAVGRSDGLLIVYKKAKFDNLPTSFLVALRQGVEDAL